MLYPVGASLSEVTAIEESRNLVVQSRIRISEIVEEPLLELCEWLYDMNIKTISSSANKKDINTDWCYIILDSESLSQTNQKIALRLGKSWNDNWTKTIKIVMPVSSQTNIDDIKKWGAKILAEFEKQPMTWAQKYTLDELKSAYWIENNDTRFDAPESWEWYHHNPGNWYFYTSIEHIEKEKDS